MNSALRVFAFAGLVATTALSAQAEIDRVVEKSFTIANPGTLYVQTQGGKIEVVPSNDSTVKVTARQVIKARDDKEEEEILAKMEFSIEQDGNNVRAKAKYDTMRDGGFRLFGRSPQVRVEFTVSMPAAMMTDLRTSGGGITVGDVSGKVLARTSGGAIKLGNLGSSVDAHTSGGGISLATAQGDVDLGTSGGSIKVGRVAGKAKLSTSGGGIEVESVENLLKASTSGGTIRAGIAGKLADDCSLSTSGGSIHVTVDKAAAFKLNASTSGGSVSADGLTITLEGDQKSRSKLVGSVNGGGPALKLSTSGGGISVRTRST